jgi:hypothetical protein
MTRRKPTTDILEPTRAPAREVAVLDEAPRGPGRPPHVPSEKTRTQVELCMAFGNTQAETAAIMGISVPTLEKYYAEEIATGSDKTLWKLGANVYRQAMKDDSKAAEHAKWILARRSAAWRDVSRHEHTGKGGGPIQHEIDYSKLTDADLEQLERILTLAAPSEADG